MATTINKISEQCIRLMEKGTQSVDSKLSKQVIAREIRQIIHKLIKGDVRQAEIDGDLTPEAHYVSTFTKTVQNESSTDRNYIDLPQYISLYNDKGIQQIRPLTGKKKDDRPMIPIRRNEMFLYDRINAGREVLKSQWCFELHRDKAYFTERDGKKLTEASITSVEVQAISVSPEDIADTDTLPIPPEMEMDVMKELLVLYGYNPNQVADMVLDGNPNVRQ